MNIQNTGLKTNPERRLEIMRQDMERSGSMTLVKIFTLNIYLKFGSLSFINQPITDSFSNFK